MMVEKEKMITDTISATMFGGESRSIERYTKGESYVAWRVIFFNTTRPYIVRTEKLIDSNNTILITEDPEAFISIIRQNYPEDLQFFLFHPEIFAGRFDE